MAEPRLSPIEEEVVFLKAAAHAIDSMVNYAMLAVNGAPGESIVLFKTGIHQRFFNVLLVDFLSRTDRRAPPDQNSFLGALRSVTDAPHFDVDDSIGLLAAAVSAMVSWLNREPRIRVWLPSIDTDVELSISRLTYLKMCGDISTCRIREGIAEGIAQPGEPHGASSVVVAGSALRGPRQTDTTPNTPWVKNKPRCSGPISTGRCGRTGARSG
jgi:hypothetical protein